GRRRRARPDLPDLGGRAPRTAQRDQPTGSVRLRPDLAGRPHGLTRCEFSRKGVLPARAGAFLPSFSSDDPRSRTNYARFHKKTKPQNSACKAASAALSGLAFHQGVLRPSALQLSLCSDFAVLCSSCRTFVFLCHSRFCAGSFIFPIDKRGKW